MFTPCIYQGYMFKNLAFVNIWEVKPPAKVNLHGVNSKSALHLPASLKKPYIYNCPHSIAPATIPIFPSLCIKIVYRA